MEDGLLVLAAELDELAQDFLTNRPQDCSDEDDILFLGIAAGYEQAARKVREFAAA